jgi:hypothetical protein
VPLSGAQAAALLRIGGEPMREADQADSGTNGVIVGAAAHGTMAHQAPASRAAGRITLAVLGLMGFSVLVQANSEQVPPNAPQSSGLVGRAPDTGARHTHDTLQGHHKMLNKITGVTAAAVVGIAATVVGAQSAAVQWKVEDGGNGHWYAGAQLPNRSSPANRWDAASLYCGERGGHLATPTSESENDFIVANAVTQIPPQFGVGQGPMLGGRLETNGWQWIDGEPWSYSGWCGSEPTGDGIHLHYWAFSNLCWNDFSGMDAITNTLIVEWSADCNSDGIVDYSQCHNGTLADYNTNNIPDCCERGEACVVGGYPMQWRTEDGGNGHWYQVTPVKRGICWEQFRDQAVLVGGYLATSTTAAENAHIYRYAIWHDVQTVPHTYLGGFQSPDACEPDCGWTWVTDEPWVYSSWADLGCCTYDEDVLELCSGIGGCGGRWRDDRACLPESIDVRAVYEWSADCNNDNIVDYGQILNGQLPDSNTNGIPDICEGPTCQDADITNNQIIDGADLGAMLAFWGPVNPVLPQADINRDGDVNGADLGSLLSFWGPCP